MSAPYRVLVLEDVQDRVDALREWLPDSEIVHVETVADFIKTTGPEGRPFDLFILDHDLGDTELPGRVAVDHMTWKWGHPKAPVVVWSQNAPAARWMVHDLERAGFDVYRRPFGMDQGPGYQRLREGWTKS